MRVGIVGAEAAKFTPQGEAEARALIRGLLSADDVVCTQEDVRMAKWAAAFCEMEALTLPPGKRADLLDVTTKLNRLADRIESLLPPEDSKG